MGWIGKLIGGTIGLLIGGPLGAIAGAALGHGVDIHRQQSGRSQGLFNGTSSYQQAQLTFFVGTFSMLAKIAKADGTVHREELQEVERFISRDLRLDPQSARIAREIFDTALMSEEKFENLAAQFYNQFKDEPQILELLIDVLYRVSAADRKLSIEEERLIKTAAEIFHFSAHHTDTIKKRYSYADETAYAVLGCTSGDTDETIKKTYKRLVFEYHPDRVASQGLPEEFTEYANTKFREIQEAYDKIRKERNF